MSKEHWLLAALGVAGIGAVVLSTRGAGQGGLTAYDPDNGYGQGGLFDAGVSGDSSDGQGGLFDAGVSGRSRSRGRAAAFDIVGEWSLLSNPRPAADPGPLGLDSCPNQPAACPPVFKRPIFTCPRGGWQQGVSAQAGSGHAFLCP